MQTDPKCYSYSLLSKLDYQLTIILFYSNYFCQSNEFSCIRFLNKDELDFSSRAQDTLLKIGRCLTSIG